MLSVALVRRVLILRASRGLGRAKLHKTVHSYARARVGACFSPLACRRALATAAMRKVVRGHCGARSAAFATPRMRAIGDCDCAREWRLFSPVFGTCAAR